MTSDSKRSSEPYSVARGQIVRGDRFVGVVKAVAELNRLDTALTRAMDRGNELERQVEMARDPERWDEFLESVGSAPVPEAPTPLVKVGVYCLRGNGHWACYDEEDAAACGTKGPDVFIAVDMEDYAMYPEWLQRTIDYDRAASSLEKELDG